MITMDAPEHGPARKAVLGEFTARRLEALRPRIQEIVDGQIDALLPGPQPRDLVDSLSLPVPSLVICEMLGVPYADHEFFQEHTVKVIKQSTVAFLRNPEQLAMIKADPGKTLNAVEEMLRYFTIIDVATARLCVEDIKVGGRLIRAGEGVLVLGYSANRDPRAFENPDELDIERGARHHVAFGFGSHQCLGQNLARMELQIVFDTLFGRVPTLELAVDVDELPFKDDASIYGLYQLPVTW